MSAQIILTLLSVAPGVHQVCALTDVIVAVSLIVLAPRARLSAQLAQTVAAEFAMEQKQQAAAKLARQVVLVSTTLPSAPPVLMDAMELVRAKKLQIRDV